MITTIPSLMHYTSMSLFALLLCFIFLVSLSSKTESRSFERRIKRHYNIDDPWNKPAWEQNDGDFPWRGRLDLVKRMQDGGTGERRGPHILLENFLWARVFPDLREDQRGSYQHWCYLFLRRADDVFFHYNITDMMMKIQICVDNHK